MKTQYGHLTYCTNIHSGESWAAHFESIKKFVPQIKAQVSADKPFGIGLRLSNEASLELVKKEVLAAFQQWLQEEDCYIFTMNGFPYGGFHRTVVKDAVHSPDWTTGERVDYTVRLANILAQLLPGQTEGSISTSPLSYRHWFQTERKKKEASAKSTQNVLTVTEHLVKLKNQTGKIVHIDVEPEPGGLIENGEEFITWYEEELLPLGVVYFNQKYGLSNDEAVATIKEHVQLCYDVCHFAIGFEDPAAVVQKLKTKGIKTGKIQISAALKATLPPVAEERKETATAFTQFNEPTYLHQVIALLKNRALKQYNDLPDALADINNNEAAEWRAHFHVPLFVKDYGLLQSTQQDIEDVLSLQQQQPFTSHLEIETYTWEVLPDALKLPLEQSIIREIRWVIDFLNNRSNGNNA